MTTTWYIFPLTVEESYQPQKTGFDLIKKNPDRAIEMPTMGNDEFNLTNYDKGRNLVVYEDVVYEIFKDYSDVTNNKRYFMLKPLLNGCEQIK